MTTYAVGQSVLASGNWYKLGIEESGIYKLDANFLTSQLGLSASVDPATIKLYGIAGGMLPQPNHIERPSDPVEIPLYASGDQDNSLDVGDFFLFYGDGPDGLAIEDTGDPEFENNLYSDISYYLLTYGGEAGRRIEQVNAPPNGGVLKPSYIDYITHELDVVNQLRSGRKWLGETFKKNQDRVQEFEYTAPNMMDSAKVWVHLAANSEGPCSFDVALNESDLGNIAVAEIPSDIYNEKIKYADSSFATRIDGSSVTLKLSFNEASGVVTSLGFLDHFVIAVKRAVSLETSNQLIIKARPGAKATYQIDKASAQTQVWDITDPTSPQELIGTRSGTPLRVDKSASQSQLIIFDGSDFPNPEFAETIDNQNIKSHAGSEGIIVTHPDFFIEAERLAAFHRSSSGLSVSVVTTDQIYNEFAAGRQDITAIRDFLRYCYLEGGQLEQALLFGDASYDYKDRVSNNTNFVPVYESHESSHTLFSHSSDDYFAFFEENEGEWFEGVRAEDKRRFIVPYEDHTMEIGIGRLPVKTREEARIVVDKIIRYKTASQTYGTWRNKIAYFSDDGDNNIHMQHSEAFFEIIDTTYAQYSARKLYLDLYDQSSTDGEPEALKVVKNAIKDGVFMFNYIGHGNESQLTQENIITLSAIRNLTNRHKLPLFVTATCEFGKYDSPIIVSGAERLMLNENGGAIALLTTTRAVYAHTNFPLNQALHENLFKKVNGQYPRLGDVIKQTKNSSLSGPINRNFSLLGDPMLTLNYPEYEVIFDQMEHEQDTLSALEKYQLSGRISASGNTVSTFSGKGVVTLFDIPQTKITEGQESNSDPFQFKDQSNALYRGEVSVTDGLFDMEFVLPKNSSYKYEPGKLTLYAWNDEDLIDASGATRNFVLGGTADGISPDNNAPDISLYLNDDQFESGGTVGTNSLLIAQLSDQSGINISENGFGQGITLQLNDEEPIILNEYYTAHQDTYESGTVMFPLQNLVPGKYTAQLKAHDTHNNVAVSTVEFRVSEQPIIRLYNAVNYPNPVSQNGSTTFRFEHDREDEKLKVRISIYNMEGRVVREVNYDIDSSPRTVDQLTLKATNYQGDALQKGIYLYRLNVTSTLDGASNEVVKRLIIIN